MDRRGQGLEILFQHRVLRKARVKKDLKVQKFSSLFP